MGAIFVGCISCTKLLVMSEDKDGQGAARAGWVASAAGSGWECPVHTIPLTATDLLARPAAEAVASR